jgi:hypothetical protein
VLLLLLLLQVTNVLVLDENPAGLEGPWVTYARMVTLRTNKALTGDMQHLLLVQQQQRSSSGSGSGSGSGMYGKGLYAVAFAVRVCRDLMRHVPPAGS